MILFDGNAWSISSIGYKYSEQYKGKTMKIFVQAIVVPVLLALFVSPAFTQGAGMEWDNLNQEVMSLYKQGQYDQGVVVARRALKVAEKNAGKNHPDVASSLNNLAELYRTQGKYAEAEPLYRRALEINKKTLGQNHPDIAVSMHNLVLLYLSQGKYEQAEPLCKSSLAIREKALDPDDFDIAVSLSDLAGVYYSQRKFEEAEPLYKRSLAISEKALGPDHPKVALLLNNLAVLYESDGKYKEAELHYRRVLSIQEETDLPDNLNVAESLKRLTGLYRTMGRTKEANELDQVRKENDLYSNTILRAAAGGSPDAVRAAIEAGEDVNSHQMGSYAEGYTPLHVAAEKGHLEVVKTLLENGAMVDARDKEMNTPLMLAVTNNGTLDVVKYLVEHGADIRAKNNRDMMPLEWVSYENDKYIHSINRKLLGKNRYEVFGKVIKFNDVELGNEGKSFWVGRTAEKCALLINGKLTEIPIGTWLHESGFGSMIFPEDISLTVGVNDIVFAKNELIQVSYDKESGNLTTQIGVLAKDMTLTVGNFKIPFFAKRYDPEYVQYRGQASMHFHDNGSISEGYVNAKDFKLKIGANEITFKGDEIMEFDKDGGISDGVMASDAVLRVGNKKIAIQGGRGNSIATYPNGNIRSGDLAEDVSLQVGKSMIAFRKASTISFYENGSVKFGTVDHEIAISVNGQKKTLEKQRLYFQEDGAIEMIYEGYKYKKRATERRS